MRESLSNDVASFFDHSRVSANKVSDLTTFLLENEKYNLFVFGGMIRDIGLFSVEKFNSDIDLVFSGSKKELHNALSAFGIDDIKENKFGGLRLNLNSWDVDIWSVENTWAFKNKHVEYKSIHDLLETTFMSWDSALFDIRKQELLIKSNYFEDLEQRHLDLVLEKTPNEIGSLVRLARTIVSKDVKTISSRVIQSIDKYSSKFHKVEVLEYEYESFETKYLSERLLDDLYSSIENIPNTRCEYIENKYSIFNK